MADKDIRKALETALQSYMTAQTPKVLISFPNIPFDTNQLHPDTGVPITEYIRASFHPVTNQVMTLGSTPRIQRTGFAKFDAYVQQGSGPDRCDDLAEMVRQAFPYSTVLQRNGIQVQLDTVDTGVPVQFQNWWYCPVKVNWWVWVS